MLLEYILLIADVICALCAFFALALCIIFATKHFEGEVDGERITLRGLRLTVLISGILFVLFSSAAYKIYMYLEFEAPETLHFFGIWYLWGFLSRLLVMTRRHQILSPYFAIEWDAMLLLPFMALGGPFVTLHLIMVVLHEKRPWEW